MIDKYDIKQVNGEDVLILHLNFNYEFGSYNLKKERHTFLEEVKEYLFHKKIDFKGTKIVLVLGGVALATLMLPIEERKIEGPVYHTSELVTQLISDGGNNFITNDKKTAEVLPEEQSQKSEEMQENLEQQNVPEEPEIVQNTQTANSSSTKPSTQVVNPSTPSKEEPTPSAPIQTEPAVTEQQITVYRTNGAVVTMTMTDYLIGVVSAEMPASFSNEALKAQAVVARTYTLKKLKEGVKLTDSVSTQAYIDTNEMRTQWGSSFSTYYNKIKNAVTSTDGKVIVYQGNYIDAVYHSTSNGKTESAQNVWGNYVPYLTSVESPWDQTASSYLRTIDKDFTVVLSLLGINESEFLQASILRNESGRVESVRVGAKVYSGIDVRSILGLRSTDFDFLMQDGVLKITTRGYGHGVGMSQYGANGMAAAGYSYDQIIRHYYTGVDLVQK